MERKIGKYTIRCTKEEITIDNFFKYIFLITTEKISTEISVNIFRYSQAKILRYSNDEKKITAVLNEIITSKLIELYSLKRLVE